MKEIFLCVIWKKIKNKQKNKTNKIKLLIKNKKNYENKQHNGRNL